MKTSRLTLLILAAGVLAACEEVPTTARGEPEVAFAVVGSQTVEILNLGSLGGARSEASAINDAGAIVGYTDLGTAVQELHAFLWQRGEVTDLGTLGGYPVIARDVNNAGLVVGESHTGRATMEAFVWNGAMRSLGTLGGTVSTAYAINDASPAVVVGSSTTAGGETHAFIWDADVQKMYDLQKALGEYKCSRAFDVNDRNHVVGMAGQQAFLWSEEDGVTILPTPVAGYAVATAINEADQITGAVLMQEGDVRAVLWDGGVMTDLGTMKEGTWSTGLGVNDAGQIVGLSGRVSTWSCAIEPTIPSTLPGLPFVRDEASLVQLSLWKDGYDGVPLDINNAGVAVGWNGSFDRPYAARWVIQFLPTTPEEATASLEEAVMSLEESGAATTGATQPLLSKLDAITRQLNKGHLTPALRLLENFIADVEGLVRRGELSETGGAALIATAQQALSLLNG